MKNIISVIARSFATKQSRKKLCKKFHLDCFAALAMTMGIFLLPPALAQEQTNTAQPIEITATKTVEWLRDKNQYVARENVIVTQGTMSIYADLLTADYRDGATSSMEIWQLTAEGNVQIKDEANTAYGDKGVYDVIGGVAVLTGGDLKLVSPDQTVTATERMEYHSNERLAKAIGNATVTRPTDTLKADTITAYFADEAASSPAAASPAPASALGGGNLDRLEGVGNVVITTPSEKLYGNKAVYNAATNIAELLGNVKIEREQNVLEGVRAEVNLTTNVSKLFGSEKQGERVRGVFFPSSKNKDNNKGQDKPVAPASPVAAPTVTFTPSPVAPPVTPVQPAPAANTAVPAPASPATVSRRIEY